MRSTSPSFRASHASSECFAKPRIPNTTRTSRRVSFTPALRSEAIVLLFLLDHAPILIEDLAISPATIGRRLMRTQLRPTVPLTLSRRLRPANNAHMNRGRIPPDESPALDPLPCHAVAAGPRTVDDGPLEGEPLARSAVHLQPGSIDHDVDEDDSVTIKAFAEAFLNEDSQSVSSQFDSPSRPILDDSPPLSVSSPTYPYSPTIVAIARSIQKQPSFKPLVSLIDSGSTYSHISVRSLPSGATPTVLERPIRGSTLTGTIKCFAVVYLRDVSLPKLNSSRRVDSFRSCVFQEPCKYNLLLGSTLPPSRSAGLRIRSPSSLRLRRAEAAFNVMQALILDDNANIMESKYAHVLLSSWPTSNPT
jgi:hypothetical protein